MSRSSPNQLLPAIQSHLYSQDLALRERAVGLLGKTNSRVAVKQLMAALTDQDRYVAIRAAWGLSLMNPALVVPYLAQALDARERAALKQAAWALGRVRSPMARRALVAALEHRSRLVREYASAGLWQHALRGFKSKKVERLLAGMLKGDRGHVALTLRHMRRAQQTPQMKKLTGSIFQRMGGASIR